MVLTVELHKFSLPAFGVKNANLWPVILYHIFIFCLIFFVPHSINIQHVVLDYFFWLSVYT